MSEETKEVVHILQAEVDKIRTRLHQLINDVANQNLVIVKLTDKLDARPPCDLHVTSMKELNDSVMRIEIINAATASKVDGFMVLANRILEKVDKDMYGDNGLVSKTSKCSNQINLQWGVLMILLTGAISLFLWRH